MPLMSEAISMTVITPMITPVTVRNERSLLARSVARANQRFSMMSLLNSFICIYPPQRPERHRDGKTKWLRGLDDSSFSFLTCSLCVAVSLWQIKYLVVKLRSDRG